MRNPFRRRRLPPEPPEAKYPASWVTLIFAGKTGAAGFLAEAGRYRHYVELFESVEMAGRYVEGLSPERLESFQGAYKEVPGFLGRLKLKTRAKTRARMVNRPVEDEAGLPGDPYRGGEL